MPDLFPSPPKSFDIKSRDDRQRETELQPDKNFETNALQQQEDRDSQPVT